MKKFIFILLLILPILLPFSGKMIFAQEYQKDWFEHPNRTNYLVSPTGFGLKKGEGLYQNAYLFYNSVGYGFTDHLSINAGVLLAPFSDNKENNGFIFTLSPKWSTPVAKNFHVGVASSLQFLVTPSQFNTTGAVYGFGTYGNANNNVSAGFGYGFDQQGVNKNPMMIVSGQFRVIKNLSIITENWFFPFTESPDFPAFSFGLRILGKKFSLDLALINVPGINFSGDSRDTISNIPLITFMVPFGKR